MTKAIDAWVNPFTPKLMKKTFQETMETYEEMASAKIMGMPEERLKGYTPTEYVTLMDELEIEKTFIPAWQMGSHYRTKTAMLWDISIEEIADIVNQYPDRFCGLCGINPWKRMDGVRELEKAVKEHGFIGAHSHVYPYGPFNDKMWYPFYTKCVELNIPLISQIGHSGEVMPNANGRPYLIDDVAIDFPELKIIAAHTGWPWVEELIALAWKHPNVYIATTAHLPRYWDPSLVRFINSRGQDKVVWGTDFPVTTPQDSLKQIEELGLKERPKAKLLRENIMRIYQL